MRAVNLVQLLGELTVPGEEDDGGTRFNSVAIPGMEAHRLALGVDGEPAILLSASDGREGKTPPSIRLEHMGVQFDVPCRLHQPNGQVAEAPFTVVGLINGDAALREHFLRVLGPFLLQLGPTPMRVQVHRAVDGLVELFQAITLPPRKSAQGLWGELFVIASAADSSILVESWHAVAEDRYDFSRGDERIEVKSTGTRIRRHRFCLDQLQPPSGARAVVASMLVESAGAGLSLGLLLQRVHQRLGSSAELRHRLDHIVAQTLGDNLTRALELRYDFELAVDTLAYFDAGDVPSIAGDLPPGVSEVRFSADLTGVTPLGAAALASGGELFQAAVPLGVTP